MKLTPSYLMLSRVVLLTAFACFFSTLMGQTAIAAVNEQHQEVDRQKQCPTIAVECPASFDYDKPLIFKVNIYGPAGPAIRYDWAISAGTIVAGLGTPTITVDMNGAGGQGITATVTIHDLSNECAKQASCSIIKEPPPSPAVLFDRYYPKSDYQGAVKKSRARRKPVRRN